MVATFFLRRTTAFILFLIVPSLHISCFRKPKETWQAFPSLPPSSRAPRAQNPLSLPFKRLPRRLYSLPLHKSLLTPNQQSFPNVFSKGNVTNQQWDIFSYNLYLRILSTLRYADAVKSKIQLFYLSLLVKLEKKLKHRKNDWKRIQAFFVRRSNSVICWKSTQFPENWSWHSSFDRVGRRWEFQQISELWIRVDYLHAKYQERLRVIRKSKEELRRHHSHTCGSL